MESFHVETQISDKSSPHPQRDGVHHLSESGNDKFVSYEVIAWIYVPPYYVPWSQAPISFSFPLSSTESTQHRRELVTKSDFIPE